MNSGWERKWNKGAVDKGDKKMSRLWFLVPGFLMSSLDWWKNNVHDSNKGVLFYFSFPSTEPNIPSLLSYHYITVWSSIKKVFSLLLLTKSYIYIKFNLSCRNHIFHHSCCWEIGCRIMGALQSGPCDSHLDNRLIFGAERCKFTYVSGITAPLKGISLVNVCNCKALYPHPCLHLCYLSGQCWKCHPAGKWTKRAGHPDTRKYWS